MEDQQYRGSYIAGFELFEKSLNGESASPLHAVRREAIARFASVGFPTVRHEEWRFTNVAPIARTAFAPVLRYDGAGVTRQVLNRVGSADGDPFMVVFVNGFWSEEFSRSAGLPAGVRIESLASALARRDEVVLSRLGSLVAAGENGFTALNTAFLREGAVITVEDRVILERPIQVVFLSRPSAEPHASYPRVLVTAGRESRLSLIETYASVSEGVYFDDAVTEVVLGEGAVVEHDRLQIESTQAFHIATMAVRQERGSNFSSNAVSLGGAIARNTVTAVLAGEGCECTLNGLTLAAGTQLIDNHTVIDHAAPHCTSHELYKSILDGKSRGVFNGKIFVRAGAQKTDAKQTNKTILLSADATINTKPQLEIFADDVKCTHGATVGQLNEEQLFYLRARGIGEEEARDMLTFAFAADVVSRIHAAPFRDQLDRLLRARLQAGRIATES